MERMVVARWSALLTSLTKLRVVDTSSFNPWVDVSSVDIQTAKKPVLAKIVLFLHRRQNAPSLG